MKQVVILGGGIAGLKVAIDLAKKLPSQTITIVDQREYHEFPYASVQALGVPTQERDSRFHISLQALAERYGFNYARGFVKSVRLQEQRVQLVHRWLPYDYLVLALGSQPVLLSPSALPLTTLADTTRAMNEVRFALQRHKHDRVQKSITFSVVGGGVHGVVLASHFYERIKFMAREYGIPLSHIHLECFEQANRLLPAHRYHVGRTVETYLTERGVGVHCNKLVTAIEQSRLVVSGGEEHMSDVTLWAGGWVASSVATEQGSLPLGSRRQVLVNNKFQVFTFPNVFCVGDQASPPFPHRRALLGETVDEAGYVASVLPLVMQNKRVEAYKPKQITEFLPLDPQNGLLLAQSHARISKLVSLRARYRNWRYRRVLQ